MWFAVALAMLPDFDYQTLSGFLAGPINSALMILLASVLLYHSKLGVQVVVEDYVGGGLKVVTLVLSTLAHVALGVTAVLAILRIALGGVG